jgi:chain length determinant protein EpsF
MLFKQILLILRAKHFLLWICAILFGVVAYLISSNLEKRYVATAQILVDLKEPEPLADHAQASAVLTPAYMGTQNDIIRSDRVVRRVVEKLGLTTNPQAISQWQKSGSLSPIEQYYGEILRGYLEIVPNRNSNVIGLRFTNPDPSFAARAANQFARTYIDTTVELKVDPERDFAVWFTQQTSTERTRLEEAQQALSQFQRDHGFAQTDERTDAVNARLNELNSQLTSIQALKAESSSRALGASESIDTSPDVLQSSVVLSLRGDIARAEAKLDEMGKEFGPNHPQVQKSRAELASLKDKLETEMRRISDSMKASNSINIDREHQLAAAVAEQRRNMLSRRAERDQLAVLERDVESAQHAYDLVTQRLSQTKLESQVDQTNLILLTEALAPSTPAGPRVGLITLVSTGLGIITGMLLALLTERIRPRIRTVQEISDVLMLPVLANLPKARSSPPRRAARRWSWRMPGASA